MKQNNLKFKRNWHTIFSKPEFSTILIFLLMLIITAVLQKDFFAGRTLRSNVNAFTPLILLSIGQGVVILSGGLDLSSGSSLSLMLCVMTQIMDKNNSTSGFLAILAALATSVVIGLVNGISVGYLRLPPVIATFATSYIWLGAALFITPTPSGEIVPWFKIFYELGGSNGGIKFPTGLLLIGFACLGWFLLLRTRTGRYIYAVGSSNENAYASGIKTAKMQTIAYIINAACIFLCALYFAGQNGAGSAHIGDPLTLQAIAAAVVGGIAMSGGKGSAFMAIIGAIIMGLVGKIIFLANIPNAFQTLVSGMIIIAAISSSALYSHLRKKSLLKGGQFNGE